MPIFWPTVIASWSQIFVTKEVRVTHQERTDNNSTEHFEMDRSHSLKSTASTEGLTKVRSHGQKSYYNDFDTESGRGRSPGVTQIEIQPYSQLPSLR